MGNNYFKSWRKNIGSLLVSLLCGFSVTAVGQETQELVIDRDTSFNEGISVSKLVIEPDTVGDGYIDIFFHGGGSIENVEIAEDAKVLFMFDNLEGGEGYHIGTVNNNGTLEIDKGMDTSLSISSVNNLGDFKDVSGVVQSVSGEAGFNASRVWAMVSGWGSYYAIAYSGEAVEDTWGVTQRECQRWDETKKDWVNIDAKAAALGNLRAFTSPFSGSIGVNQPGRYRLVLEADNNKEGEELVRTIICTKPVEIEAITENVEWKDRVFDALSINGHTNVIFDNVSAKAVEGGRSAVAINQDADVTMHLKGTNSSLDSLVVSGKLLLTHEGNTQFTDTKICNFGIFTDSTTTMQKVYGPAGLWVENLEFVEDQTAPDGTVIKTVTTTWHWADVLARKGVTMEIYKNGKWVDYQEVDSGEVEAPALRAAEMSKEWPAKSWTHFSTAVPGTYRIKYWAKKDDVETTLYSKSFVMSATSGSITDENKTIGDENGVTELEALTIAAGNTGTAVDATLTNVSIPKSEVGAPSVTVEAEANVNLTLKGTNSLGDVEVKAGAVITLKPESVGADMEGKVGITSVSNEGSFVDETATVALVKDAKNNTMIEFTDTIVYAMDNNMISVTLTAIGNSLTADYLLLGEGVERLVNGEWIDNPASSLRAGEPEDNPDQSAKAIVNLTTTEKGTYRMKVTATDIEDESHNATLYFMFEIVDLNDKIKIVTVTEEAIDGSSETYKDANMLIFNAETANPVKVTLNNIQLTQKEGYEEYTSSVIAKDKNYELTLNGKNELGAIVVEEGATATLKKGDSFKGLEATIVNAGKFTDETGTVSSVRDSRGYMMLNISEFGCIEEYSQYYLVVNYNSMEGYLADEDNVYIEKWNGTEWKQLGEKIKPTEPKQTKAAEEDDDDVSGTFYISQTVTAPGEYRFKICSEEWLNETANKRIATLYRYFTITEPAPEPSYYNIVLPEIEGATTSPAAGTYSEVEGSSFSFSLTLDPEYDQSEPEVKANGEVLTPDANGTYTIYSIYEDITIAISGVVKNTPTGNAEVEGNEVKVWSADGILRIYAPEKAALRIYAVKGGLVYAHDAIMGEHAVSLSAGVYVVVIGDRSYKLSL